MRVDQYLSEKFNISRSKAKELIQSGAVVKLKNNQHQVVSQASEKVDLESEYQIINQQLLKYVSRAGLKLEGALKQLGLNIDGFKALDIGLSTGGFSQCLLEHGAGRVVGIDVGHDQLHNSLKDKIQHYDGVNAKNLSNYDFMKPHLNSFDLIVVDVSFISLDHILPQAYQFLKEGGILLSLVKPQFELGAKALNKKGVVKDSSAYITLESKTKYLCEQLGFNVLNYFESSIEGGDGNREFFIYAKK